MGSGDVEIGPCWTHADHRGQRIYPAVLARIAWDYAGKRLWIFCDEDNAASRKGIERAGFSFAGTGTKRLGVYSVGEAAPR
jgi:RimJ/RimL family protein N-acetyltransferase